MIKKVSNFIISYENALGFPAPRAAWKSFCFQHFGLELNVCSISLQLLENLVFSVSVCKHHRSLHAKAEIYLQQY